MDDATITRVVGTVRPEPLRLCASDELAEKGTAFVFDVLHFREPARAFGYLERAKSRHDMQKPKRAMFISRLRRSRAIRRPDWPFPSGGDSGPWG